MFFCYWIPIVGKCRIPGWSGHTHRCSCSSAICQISWIKIPPHFSLGPQGWFFFPLKKSTLTGFFHIQGLIGLSILCASSGELFFWGKHLFSQTACLLWSIFLLCDLAFHSCDWGTGVIALGVCQDICLWEFCSYSKECIGKSKTKWYRCPRRLHEHRTLCSVACQECACSCSCKAFGFLQQDSSCSLWSFTAWI